jgi:plastocyanin
MNRRLFVLAAVAAACVAAVVVSVARSSNTSAGTVSNTVVVREEAGSGVFDPRSITIAAGESVTWSFEGEFVHTVTSDTMAFNSGIRLDGVFEVQFDTPGSYAYYCSLHGAPGGVGHSGTVIVEASTPTAVPTETVTPAPEECLTLGQKISLLIGIARNLREDAGRGTARYDVNRDGVIGVDDWHEVAGRPLCGARGN